MIKNIIILITALFGLQNLYSQNFDLGEYTIVKNKTIGANYSAQFEFVEENRDCISLSHVNCSMMEYTYTVEAYLDHCLDRLESFSFEYEIKDHVLTIFIKNSIDASNQHTKVACFAPNYVYKTISITAERIDEVVIKNI
ncbi:hypothetical protein N9N67_08830 [Bacteriovoracaceae bacterium]|nr:hypothetical protein [Bacteriovoracaceae bacterium]